MKIVKYKQFVFGEGWTWKAGGEGKVIAETETQFKIKVNWFFSVWIPKIYCEEVIYN